MDPSFLLGTFSSAGMCRTSLSGVSPCLTVPSLRSLLLHIFRFQDFQDSCIIITLLVIPSCLMAINIASMLTLPFLGLTQTSLLTLTSPYYSTLSLGCLLGTSNLIQSKLDTLNTPLVNPCSHKPVSPNFLHLRERQPLYSNCLGPQTCNSYRTAFSHIPSNIWLFSKETENLGFMRNFLIFKHWQRSTKRKKTM